MVIDSSDGTVYVAFQDANSSFKVTVIKYNGNTWSKVGTHGISVGQEEYINIDLDKTGTHHTG